MVCAPNAFKGTLRAEAAAAAMALGVRDAGADAVACPVADGGDGTLDVLVAAAGPAAHVSVHRVTGPLSAPVDSRIGWIQPGTAVVEMAEAAGLRLLEDGRLDAPAATSRGAGELIAAAIDLGAERVIVGVGGSASTDGGAGLLQALGARLLDARGEDLGPGGGELTRLERIDLSGLHPGLSRALIEVAADVNNPLTGPEGAAAVFAPQKGATATDVALLEAGLQRLAEVCERWLGESAAGRDDQPGAGAGGGAAYGLALIGTALRPGAALVCDLVGLDAALTGAALVLTGEGRLDAQTAFGKAPAEVALRARRAGIACAAIAGQVWDPLRGLFEAVVALENLAPDGDSRGDAAALVSAAAQGLVEQLLPAPA